MNLMQTNLGLNDRLVARVLRAGGHKTKAQAVNMALNEYIKHQKRMRLLELAGTVDFRPDWDHKADRRRDLKRIPRD